jgi:hypothetical protein
MNTPDFPQRIEFWPPGNFFGFEDARAGMRFENGPNKSIVDLKSAMPMAGLQTKATYQIKEAITLPPGRDLLEVHSIDRIKVVTFYDEARFYQYKVEVSEDGKQWQQVVDMVGNTRPSTGAGETFRFPALKARHVRIHMLKNSAYPGLHLNELLVFEAKTRTPIDP